ASLSGHDILTALANVAGMDDIRTETDPTRLRPNDPVDIVGDNSRIREDTGWEPRIALTNTIADYLKAR
ncbi:MAG: hypothetical protein ABIR57_10065, partial [Aeromicrobium sp.]